MKNVIVIVSTLVMLLGGCGYKSGVITQEEKAYLYFSGNVDDVKVSIDDGASFRVKKGQENRYKLKPGMHRIKVYRGERLIVDREIYLGDGIAKEIEVR